MASLSEMQSQVIARGLRFDAAENIGKGDKPWIARASSEDQRTHKRTGYQGRGETEEAAYDALTAALPPRADQQGPTCSLCGQALPDGIALGTARWDAPE